MSALTRRLMQRAIRFYQRAISARTGPTCRYQPTCSQYAYEAVERHGPWRGVGLAARRLGRCHPGREGGYDPVPPPRAAVAPGQPEESKTH